MKKDERGDWQLRMMREVMSSNDVTGDTVEKGYFRQMYLTQPEKFFLALTRLSEKEMVKEKFLKGKESKDLLVKDNLVKENIKDEGGDRAKQVVRKWLEDVGIKVSDILNKEDTA